MAAVGQSVLAIWRGDLKYGSTLNKWINSAITSFKLALSQLIDVFISSPSNGQVLTYNSGSSKWVISTPNTISNISSLTGDCEITNPKAGQILVYDQMKWRNHYSESAVVSFKTFFTHLTELGAVRLQNNVDAHVVDTKNMLGVTLLILPDSPYGNGVMSFYVQVLADGFGFFYHSCWWRW